MNKKNLETLRRLKKEVEECKQKLEKHSSLSLEEQARINDAVIEKNTQYIYDWLWAQALEALESIKFAEEFLTKKYKQANPWIPVANKYFQLSIPVIDAKKMKKYRVQLRETYVELSKKVDHICIMIFGD